MSDIIRRAAANIVLSQQFIETFADLFTVEIERQLRAEAGGDRVYIAKTSDTIEKEAWCELFTVEIERQLRAEAGGDRIYIAKTSDTIEKEARDASIKSRFKGDNLSALGREYSLSARQIRRICKK